MKYSDTDLQQLAALLGGTSEEARTLISTAQSEKERRAAAALPAHPEANRIDESEYAALRMQAETLGVPFEKYLREMAIMRAFVSPITEGMKQRPKARSASGVAHLSGEPLQSAEDKPSSSTH